MALWLTLVVLTVSQKLEELWVQQIYFENKAVTENDTEQTAESCDFVWGWFMGLATHSVFNFFLFKASLQMENGFSATMC